MPINIDELSVDSVMLDFQSFPVIGRQAIFKEALEKMILFNIGIACIVDKEEKLLGILTDGDIRRKLLKVQKPFSALFSDDATMHVTKSPVTVSPNDSLKKAIYLMEENQIWDIPVVGKNSKLLGLLHLHRAIKTMLEL